MKANPCSAGLKWSCLHAHSTTCKFIPMFHPTGVEVHLFLPRGTLISSKGVAWDIHFIQEGDRDTPVSSK